VCADRGDEPGAVAVWARVGGGCVNSTTYATYVRQSEAVRVRHGLQQDWLLKYGRVGLLCGILVVCVAPFVWMVSTAFNTREGIYSWPPQWWPMHPTLANFRELGLRIDIVRSFMNSAFVAIAVTIISTLLNAAGGYSFAKFNFPLRGVVFALLLLTLMLPAQVTLIPQFFLLKNLGLLNSPLGLVVPAAASVFGLFFMRQAMLGVPDDYLESARVEGCPEWRVFTSVALPMVVPAVSALAIFTFVGTWSDFMLPLVILQRESAYTLPVALAVLNGQFVAEWGLLMAGAVVGVIPLVLFFLFFQRLFIQGVTMSGLK
jgi:multiple sugar transport system permease protein